MEGYWVFNKRDCFHWLLCSRYLELPPDIIYYISRNMFYDFEPRRRMPNFIMSSPQNRVVNSVFWKKSPITIWNADRFHGKSTCAQEIASYGLRNDISVFILDSNRRRSYETAGYVYRYTWRFIDVVTVTHEIISTVDGRFVLFRPLTIGCNYLASVDILIILIRDDGCIFNLEEYLKNITYKQLVLLGDGKNSEWFKNLCKNNWFNVIN